MTDQQKQLEVIARVSDPTAHSRNMQNQRRSHLQHLEKLCLAECKELIAEMDTAYDLDRQANKESRCAMSRFKLLPKANQLLQNKPYQQVFLDNSGCTILEKWLLLNPDSSYPPVQVVEFVLELLDRLPITIEHIEECEVARALQVYSCDKAKMGQAVSQQATHLLQKWQSQLYNLSYEYDEEGLYELQQKELKRKLEVLTEQKFDYRRKGGDDDLGRISKDDELIRKSAQGTFVMYKSCFDFIEKPLPSVEDTYELRQQVKKQKSAKGALASAFVQQKLA